MNRRASHLMAGWRTGLPRPVLVLQAGNALNYLGYGLILPFEIIYLHQIRGLSIGTAGLVLAAILGTATLVTPPTGALLDHFRARPMVIAGNLASALGYGGFVLAVRPWEAFACAVIAGAGVGVAGTAIQTLLLTLVTPERRPASFALGRVAQNLGLGAGATVAGLIVSSAQHVRSFQALYLFDAMTYTAFALIVLGMVPNPQAPEGHPTAAEQGFGAVLRDRRFLTVIAVNVVLIIVGYATFANILPAFVKEHTTVGPGGIGVLFLINTSLVVVAQLPVTRALERMRRAQVFAAACAMFTIALLAVLPATLIRSELGATVLLSGVAAMFAIGECVHNVVLGPVVADLAPPHLLGRYISLLRLAVTGGFALGPAIGGAVLESSPDAVWWGGAVVATVIGAGFLIVGRRIPEHPLAATASSAPTGPAPDAA
jgi:MFS family permease